MEELLGINSDINENGVEEDPAEDETTPSQVLGAVVVKGNRSVYHGQNDRAVLLNQVQSKIPFMGFGKLRNAHDFFLTHVMFVC